MQPSTFVVYLLEPHFLFPSYFSLIFSLFVGHFFLLLLSIISEFEFEYSALCMD